MQLFCRLVPPSTLTAHPNVMFSKTWPGCRHANLVSTLGLTQGDPRPPPLKILATPLFLNLNMILRNLPEKDFSYISQSK